MSATLVLAVNLLAAGQDIRVDPVLRDQLLSEAVKKWGEYRVAIRTGYSGTYTGTGTSKQGTVRTRGRMLGMSGCLLWEGATLQDDGEEVEVHCYNPRYCFSLAKAAKGDWLLRRVTGLDANGVLDEKARAVAFDGCEVDQPVRTGTILLADLIRHPAFKILELREVSTSPTRVVLLRFDSSHRSGDRSVRHIGIQSGEVRLNPDCFWCAMSGRLKVESDQSRRDVEFSNEVQASKTGLPVPKRSTYNNALTRKNGDVDFLNSVVDLDLRPVLPSDGQNAFTLSAFGLPEPAGVELARRTPAFAWLLLAALGAGLLSVVFAWMRRRRLTRQA